MKTVMRPTACTLLPVILSILGLAVKCEVRTISCDFNSNFCGWTNTGKSLFAMTDELDILSPFNGSFVTTSSEIASEYLLSSIPFPATLPRNTSIAFWYCVRKGYEAVYLRVLSATGSVTIWERRPSSQGVRDVTWAYVEFPVVLPYGATLQFAAAVRKHGGLVALDQFVCFGEGNTIAKPGSRHPTLSCEFDRGFCEWSNQESASAKFHFIGQLPAPGLTRPHLSVANTSSIRLTVARLLSPCINILKNTKIIVTYEGTLPKYQTELVIVFRRKGALPSIVTEYNDMGGTDNLKAASNVRIGLEGRNPSYGKGLWSNSSSLAFLHPGQSVQLLNVYVANEAETVTGSDGCSDVEAEPLLSEYPHTQTVSCSFDRNLCGWQLSPQDTKTRVTIAREILDDKKFVWVPHVGEGALVIQSVPAESLEGTPLQVGPLLSPDIFQLRPTQLYFYYNGNGLVNYAFLSAEYANGSSIILWSFKQRTQGPAGEQIKKWLPVRRRLCLPGRFRLAFYVLFSVTNPILGFWLDELTVDNEADSFTTNFDVNNLSGCPISNAQSPTSITCDSSAAEFDLTNFCGWHCSDSDSNVSCNTTYVPSAGGYSSQLALKIDAGGTDLTNIQAASVISSFVMMESESQLVLTYLIHGPPVRFTLLARDSGMLTWEVVKVSNFTYSIPEWMGMNIPFSKRFHRRMMQFRLLIEFYGGKSLPSFHPVFFAMSGIWYTNEEGYTMAKQTDILPFAETCNGSTYANITCSFEDQNCDWHPTKYGNNGWNISSGHAILNGSLSRFDKDTKELHTKYHFPLSSRLRFSYLMLGSGYAFFSLVTETPQDNRFRLWKAPAGPGVDNEVGSALQWAVVEMDLCLKFPYKLIFQAAVIGGNVTILLDDLTVQDECYVLSRNVDCPLLHLLLPPFSRTPTETKLQPSWNGQHSCDFENGHLCGWQNNDHLQMQWYSEKNEDAWKGSSVSKLSWSSHSLTLPAFSYLVSPRLHATGSRIQQRGSLKVVLQFNIRLSDVGAATVELYFARTGTLPAEPIWTSHSRVKELRTSWVFVELNVPVLDAANINQLVFAVTVLDSHGFVSLDDVDLLVATDATNQVPFEIQGALLMLTILAVPTASALICLLMRYRDKASEEARQMLVGLLPRELVERFEQPFWSIKLEAQCIGEGRFGQVQLGWMGNRPVAVKRIRQKSNTERDRFLAEMAVYVKIGQHRNIVELLGITIRGEFTIIMEYCSVGCLHTYLQRESNFPKCSPFLQNQQGSTPCNEEIVQLIVFAHDVARGMVFLLNRHIVHGDIAARNVLLDQNKRAKIADFGRAKFEGDIVTEQDDSLLPAQWMAPELLVPGSDPRSCRSDVWSFGILVWEVFTLGAKPYGHFITSPNVSCKTLLDHLKAGHRLPLPHLLPETLYGILNSCWYFEPENRPPITDVIAVFAASLPCEASETYISCETESNETVKLTPAAAKI